jgi:hypothetical protein
MLPEQINILLYLTLDVECRNLGLFTDRIQTNCNRVSMYDLQKGFMNEFLLGVRKLSVAMLFCMFQFRNYLQYDTI